MSSSQLLLAGGLAAIFLAVAMVVVSFAVMTNRREQVSRSWEAVNSLQTLPSRMRPELSKPIGQRIFVPAVRRLSRLYRRFTPATRIESLRRRLEKAGSPPNWDVDRVLACKILCLVAGAVAGVAIGLGLGKPLVAVGLGLGLPVLGFYFPDAVLSHVVDQRQQRIRRELPDSMDMLTISVEAGLGFDAALAQVAKNTDGPLAHEFFRVLQEMQIGTGRGEAFRALSERVDLPDLQSFVTAVVQADTFGIPIAKILRVQSSEMRVKRRQRAEEIAQKIPIKIVFPLVVCILPAFMIVVIGPAVISIFRNIIH